MASISTCACGIALSDCRSHPHCTYKMVGRPLAAEDLPDFSLQPDRVPYREARDPTIARLVTLQTTVRVSIANLEASRWPRSGPSSTSSAR